MQFRRVARKKETTVTSFPEQQPLQTTTKSPARADTLREQLWEICRPPWQFVRPAFSLASSAPATVSLNILYINDPTTLSSTMDAVNPTASSSASTLPQPWATRPMTSSLDTGTKKSFRATSFVPKRTSLGTVVASQYYSRREDVLYAIIFSETWYILTVRLSLKLFQTKYWT